MLFLCSKVCKCNHWWPSRFIFVNKTLICQLCKVSQALAYSPSHTHTHLSNGAQSPPSLLSKFCPPLILASFHLFHLTLSKPSIRSCQHSWSFLLCGPFTTSKSPSHSHHGHHAAIKEHLKNPSRLFICLAPFYLQLPKTINNKKKGNRPLSTRINVLHFGPSQVRGRHSRWSWQSAFPSTIWLDGKIIHQMRCVLSHCCGCRCCVKLVVGMCFYKLKF